jgi:hypothetical protein
MKPIHSKRFDRLLDTIRTQHAAAAALRGPASEERCHENSGNTQDEQSCTQADEDNTEEEDINTALVRAEAEASLDELFEQLKVERMAIECLNSILLDPKCRRIQTSIEIYKQKHHLRCRRLMDLIHCSSQGKSDTRRASPAPRGVTRQPSSVIGTLSKMAGIGNRKVRFACTTAARPSPATEHRRPKPKEVYPCKIAPRCRTQGDHIPRNTRAELHEAAHAITRELHEDADATTRKLHEDVRATISELHEAAHATTRELHEDARATISELHEDARATISELDEAAHATTRELHEDAHATISELDEDAHATTRELHEDARATISELDEDAHATTRKLHEDAHATTLESQEAVTVEALSSETVEQGLASTDGSSSDSRLYGGSNQQAASNFSATSKHETKFADDFPQHFMSRAKRCLDSSPTDLTTTRPRKRRRSIVEHLPI